MIDCCPICQSAKIVDLHDNDIFNRAKCGTCNLVFRRDIDQLDTQTLIDKLYGSAWVRMRDAYAQNTFLEHATFNTSLLELVTAEKGSLLEIGSGTGEFLYCARAAGWQVTGIEASRLSCEYAADVYGLDLINSCWNAAAIEVETKFDVVTLWHVLEHMRNPIEFLQEIAGVLAPAGIIAFSVPNSNCFTTKIGGYNSSLYREEDCLFHYSVKNLGILVEKAGLETVKVFSRQEYNRLEKDLALLSQRVANYPAFNLKEKIELMHKLQTNFEGHELFCVCNRKSYQQSSDEKSLSRFFQQSDNRIRNFVFELPDIWWSRGYEYEWARQFAEPEDVCLDAACGIGHPLKFYLLDKCQAVYACDLDERITSANGILEDIAATFGQDAAAQLPSRYLNDIEYSMANITKLPYQDNMFDKIYCISVLEHTGHSAMIQSLTEFARVLKDDGVIILTFDYPNIDLLLLEKIAASLGLKFAGDVNFRLPADAIFSDIWGRLYCFRAVLAKR